MDILGVIPFLQPGRTSVAEQALLVDSFLKLRLALRAHFTWGEPITLTVTSMLEMEGKTFVAANLSLNFAEAGFQTLFVDGDHRRLGASSLFGVPTTPGLLDFQRGEAKLEADVQATNYERCYVLPYGSARPPLSSVVVPENGSLMADLRARFDVVIIDSPSWGTDKYVDALVSRTDGLVVVQRVGDAEGRSRLPDREKLSHIPIRTLGRVLVGSEIPDN